MVDPLVTNLGPSGGDRTSERLLERVKPGKMGSMTVFAVQYTYDHRSQERDQVRPAHRAFLGDLLTAGTLLASGPFTGATAGVEAEPDGALLLLRAESVAEAEQVLDGDPFALSGLIAERSLRSWDPVFGPWS